MQTGEQKLAPLTSSSERERETEAHTMAAYPLPRPKIAHLKLYS